MNSLNARESTLQRKGIKAKRANTNVTNAAKNDTRLSPERGQPHTMKQISHQNMIGKAVLRIHKITVNNKFIMYEKT